MRPPQSKVSPDGGLVQIHFLALGDAGFGELTLGLRAARDLAQHGHACRFTAPSRLVGHVRAAGFSCEPEAHDASRLRKVVAEHDLVLLVDLHLTATTLFRRRIHPSIFDGGRVGGIDTWQFRSLRAIDHRPDVTIPIDPYWRRLDDRLVPVPFGHLDDPRACNLLPRVETTSEDVARRRKQLGLGERVVAFCTSWWQHALLHTPQGLPVVQLLGRRLARVGATGVLHIGPADLPWPDDLPVRRLDALPPADFHSTLATADLVVSLNPFATTNTTAIALGIPVVAVHCSWSARGAELKMQLGYSPDPEMAAWASAHHPIPRFALWPLDWSKVLETLVIGTPYARLLHLIEVFDERRFVEQVQSLLDGPDPDWTTARRAWLAKVDALPQPAERLALVR